MENMPGLYPLLLYALILGGLLACMLGLSAITGTRRRGAAMGRALSMPFESGMVPTGSAHVRLPVQYYLVALFFVVFDVETAILFTWGTVVTESGWVGYCAAMVFILFLALSLVYLWRVGALDWGPRPPVHQPADRTGGHAT
ncbi:NADH-quinone oxidoreductase subunit A [Acetobacter sp. TBRC 12305]|uniref:NADH-quinone oxidoreductase subunit A n=1 Tax=Acetobacter garciniae TaxID=2817435 RepID=A0A939HPR1_9PROT|nr:NADH-quinone oxidoreductase subunit A [Acetobacter garciniae]MBO1325743.1 NADH-quinone oxidoreductase subunit A [Acetobacter garciniae]MBX0345643.1 NADH-quinone oxidoreductase subunit A [Acetobacter garciniae]